MALKLKWLATLKAPLSEQESAVLAYLSRPEFGYGISVSLPELVRSLPVPALALLDAIDSLAAKNLAAIHGEKTTQDLRTAFKMMEELEGPVTVAPLKIRVRYSSSGIIRDGGKLLFSDNKAVLPTILEAMGADDQQRINETSVGTTLRGWAKNRFYPALNTQP